MDDTNASEWVALAVHVYGPKADCEQVAKLAQRVATAHSALDMFVAAYSLAEFSPQVATCNYWGARLHAAARRAAKS